MMVVFLHIFINQWFVISVGRASMGQKTSKAYQSRLAHMLLSLRLHLIVTLECKHYHEKLAGALRI